MAKRKKRKQEIEEPKFQLPIEVHGVIYIILAVLAFLPGNGLIGRLVKCLGIFLFGSVYIVLPILLLIIGLFIIIKKCYPNFLDKKLRIFISFSNVLEKSLLGAYHLADQSLLIPSLNPAGLTFWPMIFPPYIIFVQQPLLHDLYGDRS